MKYSAEYLEDLEFTLDWYDALLNNEIDQQMEEFYSTFMHPDSKTDPDEVFDIGIDDEPID